MGQLSRKIKTLNQIPFLFQWADREIRRALEGGDVILTLGRESKSQEQNRKFHAMIKDIHQQCFRGYSFDGVKAVLVNQFALEMAEQGEPLANPGEKVWDWKSKEPVYVRPTTTKFRKKEAAAFIEFLHSVGAEYNVQWSEKALAVYDEMIEARAA